MAEDNRGQPRESDQPERGLAKPGQGSGQPQRGLAKPGQGSGQPQRGLAKPGQGSGQSQRGLARTGQGSGQPQRGLAKPGQGSGQPQRGLARTGQGSGQPQRGFARTGQGSGQPQRGFARTGQGSGQSQRGPVRSGQSPGQSRREPPRSGQNPARPPRESDRSQREPDQHGQEPERSGSAPERKSRLRKSARRQRSTKARVAGALLYVLFVILAAAAAATLGWVWACDLLGLNKEFASVIVTISDDTQLDSIVDILEEKGLIEYKFLFKLYARFSHAEDKIAPGTYELDTEMDYHALVTNMGSSSTTRQTTDVTIPEGYNIDQIFSLLEEKGVSTAEKLQDMAANWNYAFSWLQSIPLGDYHRLEGYLFPDTYTFEMGGNPKYVINKMLVNFDIKMDEYMAKYTAEDAPYSLHDIVIIASMIEKETDGTVSDERNDYRSISSVIYNRLENPNAETAGFLQLDSTLVYISGNRTLTEEDKAIDSPYNTYLNRGLPAGPISNPGMVSLLAAMEPANTNYYYYLLNPETWQHEYSRTYAEHQRLYARYYGND